MLFVYALQKTNKMAEESLADERSIFYQAFAWHLKNKRQQYLQENRRINPDQNDAILEEA